MVPAATVDWDGAGPLLQLLPPPCAELPGSADRLSRADLQGAPALACAGDPAYRAQTAAHVERCAQRYRSYDIGSETYQPYEGPRRLCRSPFR
ncbi:MAG TPA: BA14K family protein [Pseudaminobacter sp.]|nr:BA14K family protein [Pseudaminobacter sp.]